MSASLIVMIPVVLLGLVTALCFVGCALNTHGYGLSFGPYEDGTTGTKGCIAFWPLNDQGPPTAKDIQGNANGNYVGSVAFMTTGIVPGDVNNGLTPCTSFSNGGSVQVMTQPAFDPTQTFTVEAWVQPAWDSSDINVHAVVVTTDLTANTGYALFCDQTNVWTGVVGIGTGFVQTTPTPFSQPVTPGAGAVFYLALTFDGANLKLFVNPATTNPYAQAPVTSPMKFTPSATQLFIALGRPDMPPGQLPFNGKIQDVGFYSPALTDDLVLQHFTLGNTPLG